MSDQPLNILMVLRAPVGGLYRHVIDLSNELGRRGHKIGFLMDNLTGDAQTDARIADMAYPPALGVHRTPIPRLIGPGDLTATSKVRALADKLDISVLHGHGAKGGFNARLARIGQKGRVALYTPHGGILNYHPGSLVGTVLRRIEAMLLGSTDAVIFESTYAQSAFEEQIAPVTCLRPVIYNGLSEKEFVPIETEAPEYDFSYVGELREAKGLGYLLEAMVGLTNADGQPARIILGGGGPDREQLEDRAKELGISERLNFVGVQPARSVFAQARAVVLPSLAESLPYVLLEAAAARMPLVATDVGGVYEIFGPTADKLIPAADADVLRHAMQDLLDHPEQTRQETERRYEHVKNTFSVEHMTDQILDTYRLALARR